MENTTFSEEEKIFRAYAPIVTELVLLQEALGGIPIPKTVINTLFRWHFITDHKEARKAHAFLTEHGYWERENPHHRNGSRELTQEARTLACRVLPKFPRKNLAEMLQEHGITPVQGFIKDETLLLPPVPEKLPPMEEPSADDVRAKRLVLKRQCLVNHVFVERIFKGPLPSPLCLWIFQQVWQDTRDASPHRTYAKQMGHLEKKEKSGSAYFWQLTPSGKKLAKESGLSPTLTETQVLSAIQQLGYRVSLQENTKPDGQPVSNLKKGKRSETRRFEVLADHLRVEQVYGTEGLPTELSLAVFSRHYPDNINPQSQPNRFKRDYGFMDRVKKTGNKYFWFVTEQAKDALKQRVVKSLFTSEREIRQFIQQVMERKQQRTSCLARKQKRRIFRADHVLFETLFGGPLPSKLSVILLKHHWPTSVMPFKHRMIEKEKGYFEFIGLDDDEGIASFWTVTETGKRDLQHHDVNPSFTREEAQAFLSSHAYPMIQEMTSQKKESDSPVLSNDQKQLREELDQLAHAMSELQERFNQLSSRLQPNSSSD